MTASHASRCDANVYAPPPPQYSNADVAHSRPQVSDDYIVCHVDVPSAQQPEYGTRDVQYWGLGSLSDGKLCFVTQCKSIRSTAARVPRLRCTALAPAKHETSQTMRRGAAHAYAQHCCRSTSNAVHCTDAWGVLMIARRALLCNAKVYAAQQPEYGMGWM